MKQIISAPDSNYIFGQIPVLFKKVVLLFSILLLLLLLLLIALS